MPIPLGPVTLLLALFWVRELWLPPVGQFLLQSDQAVVSEAMVPLAGDKGRVLLAAELWRKGYAKHFVATDMPLNLPGISDTYAELVAKEVQQQGVASTAILKIARPAQNPHHEALYLRELALRKGWKSLLVVSSAQQSRRVQMIYGRVFAGTEVEVRIVALGDYNPRSWWKSSEGLSQTLGEYGQLLLAWVGYH